MQIFFAVTLVFLAFLIEMLAVHPSGIYSYSLRGYKEFTIGLSKKDVLKKINRHKTIRAIRVCEPETVYALKSRKQFVLEGDLVLSDIWICNDRSGKDFLFFFSHGALKTVLVQRLRFKKKQGSVLFSGCAPEALKDIGHHLSSQKVLKVFHEK